MLSAYARMGVAEPLGWRVSGLLSVLRYSMPGVCAWMLGVSLSLILSGCGGGGGAAVVAQGDPNAPVISIPLSPTVAEAGQASIAELAATLLPQTAQLRLSWKDTVSTASAYRLERQADSKAWVTVATVPASGGAGQMLTAEPALSMPGVYRVVAVLGNQVLALQTASGAESVVVQAGDSAGWSTVGIYLGGVSDATERSQPVVGTVPLSLRTPEGWSPRSVQWFADLKALPAAGTALTGFATLWSTQGWVEGTHLLTARVEVLPDSFMEWRRVVQVKAASVSASLNVSGTQGVVSVQVSASSAHGIASVSTWLGSTDLGTLTAPNGCVGKLCTTPNAFVYSVDTRSIPQGKYLFRSVITDTRGEAVTVTREVTFANPPALTVLQPSDGQWVYGSLVVTGTTLSPHAVTTQISLGNVPIGSSTNSTWSTTYALGGIPPGSYLLTVRATDAQGLPTTSTRSVHVVSDPSMVLAPLFAMGASGRLLSAQGADVLWQAEDGAVSRRRVNGESVILAGSASLRYAADWQIDQGHVVAYGQAEDCVAPLFVCVYAWAPDGTRRNLSLAVGGSRAYDQHPVLRYPWVMWINQSSVGQYTFQHLNPLGAQVAQYRITQPASVTGTLGNWRYDFTVLSQAGADDGLTAFFWGTLATSGTTVGPRGDVFKWTSAGLSTVALTASDAQQVYVQTDGQRVAWQKRTPGGVDAPYQLVSAPTGATGTTGQTVHSTAMTRFLLKDGWLVWHEGDASAVTGQRLLANDGVSTVSLSTHATANLLAVAGGSVVWSEAGRLYAWSRTRGTRVLLDVFSAGLISDGQAVYFSAGAQGSVYRLSLP